ncbi:putative receptor-like protein kinase, partial [Camellia lanceoleosa]
FGGVFVNEALPSVLLPRPLLGSAGRLFGGESKHRAFCLHSWGGGCSLGRLWGLGLPFLPEFDLGSEMSTDGDVYSYGILLLEMITGKRPTDSIFEEGLNLHTFSRMALPNY